MSDDSNAARKKNFLHEVPQIDEVQDNEKSTKKKSNKFFYKVRNHHELFKIGVSFFKDYQMGVKSFAISSTGYPQSQQNSILGLASFFDHKSDARIGIISDSIDEGVFQKVVKKSSESQLLLSNNVPFQTHTFHQHFDFLNLDKILDLVQDEEIAGYDEIIDEMFDYYDVVFWDVPDLLKIKNDSERYFPFIMKVDSLSIIAAMAISNSKDIDKIVQFFQGYGISLKGLLFDSPTENQSKKETKVTEKKIKSLWRILS
ncbi:MAG: hypothetical protein ACPGJV_01185 [Bacteriovoracaceae bacterium]